jgi:glyoxylase-like metal-dependent hydrolase (beta-lactamase superfamily II)
MNNIVMLKIDFEYGGAQQTIFPVLLQDAHEVILVDCGYPNFLPLIASAADENGIDLSKLTKIIITHHDFDHMGSAAAFKRRYPHVKILASKEEEPYISGDIKSLRLQQAESIYKSLPEDQKTDAKSFQQYLESIENVSVDLLLKDGEFFPYCGGIEIIATPGHMPGHISIYVKDHKTLIAGDAVVVENDNLAIANPQYTLDMEEAQRSILKLLPYEIDKIICYHGGIYTKDIKESLRELSSET